MMNKIYKISLACLLVVLTGCASHGSFYDKYSRTITGTAMGAAGGALLGHAANHENGVYIGSASGALVGGAIGYYLDGGFDNGRNRDARPHDRGYAYDQNPPVQTYPYR